MIKQIAAMSLLCSCISEVKAHDFTESLGGTVVSSFDLSGSDIWHGYFMPDKVLLALPISSSPQEGFKYLNHPSYLQQELPEHRMVCIIDSGRPGNDVQDRCNDEFPHVHMDDFKMALKFANGLCGDFGPEVSPRFNEPDTFVGLSHSPADSHHFYYQLAHGLKFDCIAPALELSKY